MKKIIKPCLILMTVAGMLLMSACNQNAPKLGYVRSGVLLEKAVIAAEARQKLVSEREEIDKNIKTLEEKLKTNHEAFMAEQEKLDDAQRRERIKALAEEEATLNRYSRESGNKIASREAELMGPVLDIINARIAKFAEKEGYLMIWGTLNEGNILYGHKSVDVTDDVVSFVNEKK